MKQQQIQNIVIHTVSASAQGKVTAFHVDVIERRLSQSKLSVSQKNKVIDKIIHTLKSREGSNIIK